MLPFFHPTTVLVADDDRLFLQSFAYSYGDKFLCRLERSPEAVVHELIKSHEVWQQTHVLLQPLSEQVDGWVSPGDYLVQLRTSAVSHWLQDPRRFATISVLIVDYVMPSMSGIELCRRVKKLPVKKILLTGRAGDHTAVEAFNEGLIDHFLVKHDPDIGRKLPELVERLQQEYFADAAQPLGMLMDFRSKSFLADPLVVRHIQNLLARQRAVEYYVSIDPAGVVFADETGRVRFIAAADEDERCAQLEIAEAANAPSELIAALRNIEQVAVFPSATGRFDESMRHGWRHYLHPSERVSGLEGQWWISVVEEQLCPAGIPRSGTSLASYKASINDPSA